MSRSGNRQLNAAIHRIAVTQIRLEGLGKTYYAKKKAEGPGARVGDQQHRDVHPEALRCLSLARIVFNHLITDNQSPCRDQTRSRRLT